MSPNVSQFTYDHTKILRIIAFLLIFIFHGTIFIGDILPKKHFWANLLYTPAWGGVWIFFTIAGFFAGYSFKNRKYILSVLGVFQYYKRRFLRIAPGYYFFIFILALLSCTSFFYQNPFIFFETFCFSV